MGKLVTDHPHEQPEDNADETVDVESVHDETMEGPTTRTLE
jgi:hypothetical protein